MPVGPPMGMMARDISSRWGYLNLAQYKVGKRNTPCGGWEYEAKLTS